MRTKGTAGVAFRWERKEHCRVRHAILAETVVYYLRANTSVPRFVGASVWTREGVSQHLLPRRRKLNRGTTSNGLQPNRRFRVIRGHAGLIQPAVYAAAAIVKNRSWTRPPGWAPLCRCPCEQPDNHLDTVLVADADSRRTPRVRAPRVSRPPPPPSTQRMTPTVDRQGPTTSDCTGHSLPRQSIVKSDSALPRGHQPKCRRG